MRSLPPIYLNSQPILPAASKSLPRKVAAWLDRQDVVTKNLFVFGWAFFLMETVLRSLLWMVHFFQ